MPEEAGAVAESQGAQQPSSISDGGSSNAYHHKLGESGDGDTRGTNDSESNGQKAQRPEDQKLSRYERTKRQREVLRAREAALQQKEQEFARKERAAQEAAKPKRDYTVAELTKYRSEWEREGKYDLVEAADKEIATMNAEAEAERKARTIEYPANNTPAFRTEWERAESELAQVDPEFLRAGTRLDAKLREIMASEDGNIYRQHPRGIVAAYHRAKMELLEGEYKDLQTRYSKNEAELKRYQGYTSIGSGAPARVGSGGRVESLNDFERLSTKDMRKHLLANAEKHGTPWF
jgi:hypothetical protein